MQLNTPSYKNWITILKGFLIILVIFGHTTTDKYVLNYLSSFYMPCFFVLSGWLIKKEADLAVFVKKKVKSVLMPYLFFAVIWVLFCFAKSFVVESDFNLVRALLSIILPYSGSTGGNAYNLWFLPCLFLAQVLLGLFVYSKRNGKILAVIIYLSFLVSGIIIKPYCSLLYATAIATVFVGVGFYLSNYLSASVNNTKHSLILPLTIGLVVHIGTFALNVVVLGNNLDFSAASFGILPLYILGALSAVLVVIVLTSQIKKLQPIEYIGKNSLVYYALHYEVLALVTFVVEKVTSIGIISTIVSFVATCLLTTIIVAIYNKIAVGNLFK